MHVSEHFNFGKWLGRDKELIEMYICMFIRSLSFSLIGIFVPIYLLFDLKFGLQKTLLFYVVWCLAVIILTPIGAKISAKVGFKHCMLIGTPFHIIYFVLLHFLKFYNIPYALVALFSAVGSSIFWIAFHTDFATSSHKNHRGSEVGTWYSISMIPGLFGPFLGGLVLTYWGFAPLFALSAFLLFCCVIPLFLTRDVHKPVHFSLKYILVKKHLKDFTIFMANGLRGFTGAILWPIFIFLMLKTYLALGIIASITGAFTAVFTFFIGKLSDKVSYRSMIRTGTIIDSITWFFRHIFQTAIAIFGVTTISTLSFMAVDVPFNALMYNKAKKDRVVEYLVMREVGLTVGRMILVLLVFLVSLKFDLLASLKTGFILTGFTNFLHLLF